MFLYKVPRLVIQVIKSSSLSGVSEFWEDVDARSSADERKRQVMPKELQTALSYLL